MDEIKLKPCPFCGGEASLKFAHGKFDWSADLNYVKCTKCGTKGPVYHSNLTDEVYKAKLAIAAWNRRSAVSKEEALNALEHLVYCSPHEATQSVVAKKHYKEILRRFIEQVGYKENE